MQGNRDIHLDEIAVYAGYSKYHLNRIFTEQVGCTMFKYVKKRRLDIAAEKLAGTDDPIIDIAADAGYGSQQAFTLAFRKEYLLAPQQYRIRRVHISGVRAKNHAVMRLPVCNLYFGRMAA
ncbi:MAG: helix-turn-helix transcriptional regulator [Lachnospiraceae bacterium]